MSSEKSSNIVNVNVRDRCTVRAWKKEFDKLDVLNPHAVVTLQNYVSDVDCMTKYLLCKTNDNYCEITHKTEVIDDTLPFNIVHLKEGKHSYASVRNALSDQDIQNGEIADKFTDMDQYLRSFEKFDVNDRLTELKRSIVCVQNFNRRYLFAENWTWYTELQLQKECGNCLPQDFDELFGQCPTKRTVLVCKIPFKMFSDALFKKNVVEDLLERYNSRKTLDV